MAAAWQLGREVKMARLPTYQRLGVRSAQPANVDFANFRENVRFGQTISQTVDQMSDFLYREQIKKDEQQAGEIVREMGAQPVLGKLRAAGGPTTAGERKAYEIANRIASSEIETDAMLEIDRIVTEGQNSETPLAEIQTRLTDVVDGFPAALSDLDPEVAGVLQTKLGSHAATAGFRYSNYWSKKLEDDARGRAIIGIDQRQKEIFRNASSIADPNMRSVAVSIGLENLATYMRDNGSDEAAISKIVIHTTEQSVIDGTIADFQRLGNLKDQEAFLADLTKNPPKELGVEKTRSLVRSLNAETNNARSFLKGEGRDLVRDIGDLQQILEKGGDPGEAQIIQMAQRILQLPEEYRGPAEDKLNEFYQIRTQMVGFRKMGPVELDLAIKEMSDGIPGAGAKGLDTKVEVAILNSAQALYNNMVRGLEEDPVSYAVRAGQIDFKPVLLPAMNEPGRVTEEQASASWLDRIQAARRVQRIYGGPLKLLTNQEISVLSNILEEGDRGARLNLLQEINRYAGSLAPDILEQVSKQSDQMAHVGGLLSLGAQDAANFALAGFDLLKQGNKPPGINSDEAKSFYMSEVGQALLFQSQALATGRKVVEAIYTKKAFDKGVEEFDGRLYNEAINEAFGRNPYTGNGGFDEIRDQKILLPSALNKNDLNKMLDKITIDELQENTGLIDIDPKIVKQINDDNDIFPVLLDEGRYYLMFETSNAYSTGRKYFTDKHGNPIILDALKYFNLRQSDPGGEM